MTDMKLQSSLPTIVPSRLLLFAMGLAAGFNGCSTLSAIAITALLSLSIYRSIIEAREARMWASSNAGPGINLWLVLPLRARRRHGP
jgi:hypothetical protein